MTEHAENFIPWSMIEPLVVKGMTFHELARLALARLGLDDRYVLVTRPYIGEPLPTVLRDGLHVVPKDTPVGKKVGREVIA